MSSSTLNLICITLIISLDSYVIDFHSEFLKIVHIDWIRKYGSIYRAWGGTRPVVVISSPELMEVRERNIQFV